MTDEPIEQIEAIPVDGPQVTPEMIRAVLGELRSRVKNRHQLPSRKGAHQTAETRAKISAANSGRKRSPEHVAALLAGRKAARERKKEAME